MRKAVFISLDIWMLAFSPSTPSIPAITRRRVVLPVPFFAINAIFCPFDIDKSMSEKRTFSPYDFDTCSNERYCIMSHFFLSHKGEKIMAAYEVLIHRKEG